MRKIAAMLFAAWFCLLALSACVKPGEFESESGSPENEAKFPDYVFQPELAQHSAGKSAAVGADGYYFIANRILYFYKIDAEEAFPLCTKASCLHKDQTCNAFANDSWITEQDKAEYPLNCHGYHMIPDRSCLYMFSRDQNFDLYLDRYGTDFSDKETLAKLTDSTAEPRKLTVGDPETLSRNGWLYYVTFLCDAGKISNRDFSTSFTLSRVRLEKNAVPEELYTFDMQLDFLGEPGIVKLFSSGEDIFCICGCFDPGFAGERDSHMQEKIIRYNETEGGKVLWSYSGEEVVSLFDEDEGGSYRIDQTCLNDGQLFALSRMKRGKGLEDYVPSDPYESVLEEATAIQKTDLNTKESKTIYETPFWWITEMKTDGKYLYITEVDEYRVYLTALDSEGKVINRHLFALSDARTAELEKMKADFEETQGHPITAWGQKIDLLMADARHLMLRTVNTNEFSELHADKTPSPELNDIDTAFGLINTEDFLSGKDFEIERIYAYGE